MRSWAPFSCGNAGSNELVGFFGDQPVTACKRLQVVTGEQESGVLIDDSQGKALDARLVIGAARCAGLDYRRAVPPDPLRCSAGATCSRFYD